MPGDSDPRIFLSDHLPSRSRPSPARIVELALEAGWPRDRETLAELVAVVSAESARDPRGFLAYIDLGVDRHSAKGEKLMDQIHEFDRAHPGMTLTTYRRELRKRFGVTVTRADVGLAQIGKTFPGWRRESLNSKVPLAELTDPAANLERALRLYESRGWQPWAAYTHARPGAQEPPYRQFMPDAYKVVDRVLAHAPA